MNLSFSLFHGPDLEFIFAYWMLLGGHVTSGQRIESQDFSQEGEATK